MSDCMSDQSDCMSDWLVYHKDSLVLTLDIIANMEGGKATASYRPPRGGGGVFVSMNVRF